MPNGVTQDSHTDSSISVSWTVPVYLGERHDLFYTVEYSDPDNVGVMLEMDCSDSGCLRDTRCTITDLRPATKYVVRVTAHNGVSDQDAGGALARQKQVTFMTDIAREFQLYKTCPDTALCNC